MKRVGMAATLIGVVFALAAVTASSVSANTCLKVLSPGIGNLDSTCLAGSTGEYRSLTSVLPFGRNTVCGKVPSPQGVYSSGTCLVLGGAEEWVRADYRGWVVNMQGVAVNTALLAASFTGNYVLLGTPFLVATHIECTKVHESGTIGNEGTGSATLEFSSCAVAKPANCKVKEPITTEVNTKLLTPETGNLEDEFKPKSGETFTTITLEGVSCALKEPFKVNGTQDCGLPGAETEAVGHEIECTTAGSKLTAGGHSATFEGTIKGLDVETKQEWFGT